GVLAGRHPRLDPCRAPFDVDVERLHVREVEHDAAVGDTVPGQTMASTAHSQFKAAFTGELHHTDHFQRIDGAGDDGRPAVEVTYKHGAPLVISRVARREDTLVAIEG